MTTASSPVSGPALLPLIATAATSFSHHVTVLASSHPAVGAPGEVADVATRTVTLMTILGRGAGNVLEFLTTHLVSAMLPAFLIAGAIAIFIAKERIVALMGPKASGWVAYPVAAFSGGILTVCSCGVIPIFTGILQQGAGLGPAVTFLFASPAINLISLVYTAQWLGPWFFGGRIVAVAASAIGIGLMMRLCFGQPSPLAGSSPVVVADDDEPMRPLWQDGVFFLLLVAIMVTASGMFDLLYDRTAAGNAIHAWLGWQDRGFSRLASKMVALLPQLATLIVICRRWFHRDEIKLWLVKSASLVRLILPKVILGVFVSGCLEVFLRPIGFLNVFAANDLPSNGLASVIGSIMYFGSIVGVNLVDTMSCLGMATGPALALLLAGPAVSLPSVLAITPILGLRRAVAYFALVVIASALCGFLFGMVYPVRDFYVLIRP